MSKFTILPISEALKEFQLMEFSLVFYDEGLRGLIRDHVLVSNARMSDIDFYATTDDADPLEKKVVDQYHNSSYYRHDVEMGNDNLTLNAALMASKRIRKWVNGMMYAAFVHDVYSVHEQHYRWFGNDLIVKIDIWS